MFPEPEEHLVVDEVTREERLDARRPKRGMRVIAYIGPMTLSGWPSSMIVSPSSIGAVGIFGAFVPSTDTSASP
jgi:hypothetical protein